MTEGFKSARSQKKSDSDFSEQELFSQIGQLKVELDWLKKNLRFSVEFRRKIIDPSNFQLSVAKQCELLGLSRSRFYYEPVQTSRENLTMMRLIDEKYLKYPFYGSRRIAETIGRYLRQAENRKMIQRLMRVMGIEAVYPKPNLSRKDESHRIFPYLLRNLSIERLLNRCHPHY